MASCAWSCNGFGRCYGFEDCRHLDQMSRLTTVQLNMIDDWRVSLQTHRRHGTSYENPLRDKFSHGRVYG